MTSTAQEITCLVISAEEFHLSFHPSLSLSLRCKESFIAGNVYSRERWSEHPVPDDT